MHWVIISSAFPPFRAAEADYCATLAEQLARRGIQITVVTTRGHDVQLGARTSSAYRVLDPMEKWNWWEQRRLVRTIETLNPDRVIVLYLGWIYFDQTMVTYLPTALRRRKIPCDTIFYNRYGVDPENTGLFNRALHRLKRYRFRAPALPIQFGSLLADSERVLAFCEPHANAFRVVDRSVAPKLSIFPALPLIPLAPDPARARTAGRARLGLGADEKAIVFFGYLYHNKGLTTLIRALGLLKAKGVRPRLVLLGGQIDDRAAGTHSYGDSLKMLAKEVGVADQLQFTGDYRYGETWPSENLYAADAFCLPFDVGISLNNSSVATVLWHRAPLVSTTRVDLEPAFRDGENVLLVKPKEPIALADALTRALTDGPVRDRLIAGGRDLAAREFSWDIASQLLGVPASPPAGGRATGTATAR